MNVDQYLSSDDRRRYGSLRLLLSTLLLAGLCVLIAEPTDLLRAGHALLQLGVTLASNF
jgi:hypothetical protein